MSPLVALLAVLAAQLPPGPGLPRAPVPEDRLLEPLAMLGPPEAAGFHGVAAMSRGVLVVPAAWGAGNGAYVFYDISDPARPHMVGRAADIDMREGHSIGFSLHEGRTLAAVQAGYGVQLWDWTDVKKPERLSYLHLPDIEPSDYDTGAWWVFWQAPWVFVAGSSRGLYVVDAKDPSKPELAARVPTTRLGGFRTGSLFAVGNLLTIAGNDQAGIATIDIGNPLRPALLDFDATRTSYSTMLNGERLYVAGNEFDMGLHVLDLSDPTRIRTAGRFPLADKGGYVTLQDDIAFVGVSALGFYKIDARDPRRMKELARADLPDPRVDLDFISVLGNLVILSDDDGFGSAIIAHQGERDSTPPRVNMVNPRDGALEQPLGTRIGVTLTDRLDLESLGPDSFLVRPVGGKPLAGRYSSQTGIANFAPAERLRPGTTYEVVVPAGGMRDVSGNAIDREFSSRFSTGSEVSPIGCELAPMVARREGEIVELAPVSCSAGDLRFTWDFGDGGAPAGPRADPRASHRYARPGRFVVRLEVSDGARVARQSFVQLVTAIPAPWPATRSSTIVHDARRGRVWKVNPDHHSVTAIDAAALKPVLEAEVGRDPRSLALAPDGTLWVACAGEGTVDVLDGERGTRLARIPLGRASRPSAIAVSPRAPRGWVSLEAPGELVELDLASRRATRRIAVGPTPRGIAVGPDGSRILVTRFLSPAGHGEVVELAAESLAVTRRFELPFDRGPDTESSGRGVPNYLFGATIAPDGRRAWIPGKKDNTARGLGRDGRPLTFDSTVRAMVAQIDLASGQEDLAARRDLNNRCLPAAIVLSPSGDLAYVASLGSNTIDVLDAYDGRAVTALEEAGKAPAGLVLSPDGKLLFVDAFLSRDVLVYDVSQAAENGGRLLARVPATAKEPLAPEVLKGKKIFYDSSDRRMSKDGYIACVACHLDGDSDGRVWDFSDRGEGLRNTIALAGRGGLRQGPLHWSGNFDELQDFEHDMRGPFLGRGFLADEEFRRGRREDPLGDPKAGVSPELDALAAYVTSLERVPPSPFRGDDGAFSSAARRGGELFHSAAVGCAGCHSGSELTGSRLGPRAAGLQDVGTLRATSGRRLRGPLTGLDTPSLLGVWETPPYLHDGSAATLEDVIAAANPADRHGRTAGLSAADRQALVRYLLELEEPAGNVLGPAIGAPTGLWPRPGAKDVCRAPELSWSEVPGALAYHVYLGRSEPAPFAARVESPRFRPGRLEAWTAHHWRVEAVMPGWASPAAAASFTTESPFGVAVEELNRYELVTFTRGSPFFADRPFPITALPAELERRMGIRTRNDDKSAASEEWLRFRLGGEAVVWVAYDVRATARPRWLESFEDSGLEVGVGDAAQGAARLYRRRFPAGPVVLGANQAAGSAGAGSNYAVFIVPTGEAPVERKCAAELPEGR